MKNKALKRKYESHFWKCYNGFVPLLLVFLLLIIYTLITI